MNDKILMVDDDQNALEGYKRLLSKRFNLETALCAEEGLKCLCEKGPYAVVVSDQRMPRIDGVEFLSRVCTVAPLTVRMMLSGKAELDDAIDAVNEGNIFRFLKKPCPVDKLTKALEAAIQQHKLMTVERDMVENTLRGGISILTDILSMVSPLAFGRSVRVRHLSRKIAQAVDCKDIPQLEIAALLSQIGCVIVPEEVLLRAYNGENLSLEEQLMLDEHPQIGSSLLTKIPRLETVSFIVKHQHARYDQLKELLKDDDEELIQSMQILKLALDYDHLEMTEKVSGSFAWPVLMNRMKKGWYQSQVVMAFKEIIEKDEQEVRHVTAIKSSNFLEQRMIILEDLMSQNGDLIVGKGYHVTEALRRRLSNLEKRVPLRYPIMVSLEN
ncbi:Uncharacterized protein SCG7109_AA_00500 [Chlamydiales bacterium SCGC AG-110-M15]|nr:Uncharacterized protein SCG7109_AA_00500 [Chlamydiales bacterium SCGC AG-110-M15]